MPSEDFLRRLDDIQRWQAEQGQKTSPMRGVHTLLQENHPNWPAIEVPPVRHRCQRWALERQPRLIVTWTGRMRHAVFTARAQINDPRVLAAKIENLRQDPDLRPYMSQLYCPCGNYQWSVRRDDGWMRTRWADDKNGRRRWPQKYTGLPSGDHDQVREVPSPAPPVFWEDLPELRIPRSGDTVNSLADAM